MRGPTAVLAIWHDIDAAHEKEVLHWYNREHHLERLGVPGFQRARRFVAIDASAKFFVHYDVEQPEVLGSQAYLARVNNPTPWTRSAMPWFRNNARTACRIAHRAGTVEGAYALTIRLSPRAGAETSLKSVLVERIFPALRERQLIVSTDLWTSLEGITRIHSQERSIRIMPDQVDNWIVVVGATDPTALSELLDADLATSALLEEGAAPAMLVGRYQLQFAATAIP